MNNSPHNEGLQLSNLTKFPSLKCQLLTDQISPILFLSIFKTVDVLDFFFLLFPPQVEIKILTIWTHSVVKVEFIALRFTEALTQAPHSFMVNSRLFLRRLFKTRSYTIFICKPVVPFVCFSTLCLKWSS